ncbi:hypothetical protein PINS_up005263 [Pythium insidiosum]|nr:hypothetical protein PINS_up005263 [Pythium insidiosum]
MRLGDSRVKPFAARAANAVNTRESSSEHATYYELTSVTPLPVIDATRTIKTLLFSQRAHRQLNRVIRQISPVLMTSYFVGFVLRLVVVVIAPRLAEPLAITVAVLQLPGLLVQFLSTRHEFLRPLIRTFEFWFFCLTNTACLVLMLMLFRDSRALIAPVIWVEAESLTLADTSLTAAKATSVAALTIGASLMELAAALFFGWLRDLHDVLLLATPTQQLFVKDVLVNTIVTIAILSIRIAYRRRRTLGIGSKRNKTSARQCLLLRTRLQWHALTSSSSSSPPLNDARLATERSRRLDSLTSTRVLVLQATAIDERFRLANTLAPHVCTLQRPLSSLQRVLLLAVGLVGIVATAVAASAKEIHPHIPLTPVLTATTSALAIAGTTVYCGLFWIHMNRQILRRLATSFDVVFLLVQITLMHLAVCDMVAWDVAPTVGVLCLWCWITWVLTLDALTPETKRRLGGFRVSHAAPVVVLYLVALVLVSVETLWRRRWGLCNRVLVDVGGMRLTTWSLLFGRLSTVLVWCCRVLYRISWARASDDELVMLLGNVEYEYHRPKTERRRRGRRIALAVVPSFR